MSASPSIVRVAKTAAAAAAAARPRLQEYLVVIRDLPHGDRTSVPTAPISLAHQTFAGQILHAHREDTTTASHRKAASKPGNVIALRAASREAVHEQLANHPYAQGIWDLNTVRIWPVETVHTSALGSREEEK
ncbi:hypothetical protein ASPVEDRAFT_81195 [Aspergillus versicolor CBS 583.65]|uniref:YCII-related domain-containing protein n=1 Tax=Aspergillus versicolor CBS 583.65 TaxID=1036611 RepID=A0A1L9PDK0_ASPVE|nr:uncharacterized protein ASPVEDRAFT_81195 [Aspergillus versicolor CBS 583.65]OJI99590.1 hypothetical protein ASPVEDRAFT_81195 [Aspergillus versicolor CBS 583.65]